LADGTKVERRISKRHITLPQGDGHTPIILGEPGDEALLGAVTLEILGLVLNPFKRSLEPMRAMLAYKQPASPGMLAITMDGEGNGTGRLRPAAITAAMGSPSRA